MDHATITLWGRRSSFHTRKVIWALEELALPYTIIEAGFGVEPSAEFRARNPNLLAPVIDDAGVVVWESNVIVRYLCTAHGDGALARTGSLAARFEAEQWMDWNATTLWPALRPLHHARVRGQALDEDRRATLEGEVGRWLDVLEQRLATAEHLADDAFSMADIPAGLTTERAARLDLVGDRPNLLRWWSALAARPAFPGA
jgi:glutathione S-transferase